ncbi:hypothetical protein GRF29_69g846993 [Pseudopithomyces chartarum]|uniref:Plectin/eS10 N-terminal domain-containing protein n=1 Tax=Pseudopithomyces chartarum TaxID=1892770 RepID=A0AAN6LXR7_9PLEO|nr:hypothetical protein GRF29_69g846993 [Pseudopithomyces chartarum]
MLMNKADRRQIHEYIFREGALVAKKDFNVAKHSAIDTENLFVIKACQSLTSRGYLKTRFSWQYYYYTLTPEGTDSSRPTNFVQCSQALPRNMGGGDGEHRGSGRGRGGDRDGYRRRDAGKKGQGGAPGGFAPDFRGGFGRGNGGRDA